MNTTKTQTLIRLLLVAAILAAVNFISVRLFSRVDLTKQGVYTLSDASKTLVKNLDDRVTVKAFFTESLPAPYNNNRRAVLDILNEYRAFASGNLQYEFINPEGDKGEEEARKQGIPAVEVQVIEKDQLVVKKAHLGLVLLYEDRKETLPVVQNLSSLEYDLSSMMKRLTQHGRKKVGYTTGHGELDLMQQKSASQLLSQQYDMAPVDLSGAAPVPADVAALLVIAPSQKFSDTAQYHIDQFLMRGGKAAFLLNRMNVNLNAQYRLAQPVETGLETQLEHYGVRVNGDLVRDAQCANITVMQQQFGFQIQSQIPFPSMPNASAFDAANPVVKDLQNVIFGFVSSIDTSLASLRGVKAEVLVRTSKRSGRQAGMTVVDPFQRYEATDLAESGIPLAVAVQGEFKSYFEGKPMSPERTKSPQTTILVVGDGDFMKDDFAGNRSNPVFFQNIVDYLADDAGLITIRSKNVAQPPLDQVTDGTKAMLKWGNLLVPPALVVLYGLARWRRRIAMKKSLEASA